MVLGGLSKGVWLMKREVDAVVAVAAAAAAVVKGEGGIGDS